MRGFFFALVLACPSLASADAIGPGPVCPPGAQPRASHGGRFCAALECTSSACADGASCRAWRICTRDITISSGGRRPGPSPQRTVSAIVATCAPEARCNGTEEPPAPGARQGGPISCRETRACIPAALPPLPSPSRAAPAPRAAARRATPRKTALGCTAAPFERGGAFVCIVAMLALLARRRFLPLALLLCAGTASAQTLPNGFRAHATPGGISDVRALACSRERAFVRSWQGDLAVWDGTSFQNIAGGPRDLRGAELSAAPNGHVFLGGWDDVVRWDGRAWSHFAFDAPSRSVRALFALNERTVYAAAPGRILQWTGERFRAYDPGTWREIVALSGTGTELWIATEGPLVLRHDGRAWRRIALPPSALSVEALFVAAPNDVWILASGNVLHWEGNSWQPRTNGLGGSGISAIGGSRGRVYGAGMAGIMRWNRTEWTTEIAYSALVGRDYHDLASLCTTDRHLLVADRTASTVYVRELASR